MKPIKLAIMFIVAVFTFTCLICIKTWHISNSTKCIYKYTYFNEPNDICTDKVKISSTDLNVLIEILNNKHFIYSLDALSGFTSEYSLEFYCKNGILCSLQIQYGEHGIIKYENTNLIVELSPPEKELFYNTLNKYHRFDDILLAG